MDHKIDWREVTKKLIVVLGEFGKKKKRKLKQLREEISRKTAKQPRGRKPKGEGNTKKSEFASKTSTGARS